MSEPAAEMMQPETAEPPTAAQVAHAHEALKAIVERLQREADDRVAKRQTVEKRWLEDLRQFHGEYEEKVEKELDDAKKSKLFINQTRPKTNAAEARLSDMLFPTDDDNWGIKPTPVPELSDGAKKAVEQAKALVGQANEAMQAGEADAARATAEKAQAAADVAIRLKAEMDEARKRSDSMADEIRDQLTECGYPITARDVIRDACQIGTGVVLGPVGSTDRVRRSWKKMQDAGGAAVYQLEMIEDARPAFYRVDYWGFFPEPDARTVQESESFFERHLKTRKDMRALAKQPGFDPEAIRRLLDGSPSATLPTYLTELRAITAENAAPTDTRYQVWVYRGPLEIEDLRMLCACTGKDKIAAQYAGDDIDPLTEINVVLWFCEGEVLKFGIHHLDSQECVYSVYNLEKDNSSIWGFGIPYIMRNSQKAMNGAWRMMMDNSGLSSGPQIEIDRDIIEPVDGQWTLTPRKLWLRRAGKPAGSPGIRTYDIPSHQPEIANIIALAKQFIDDETAISVLAQGEQGTHTTQTANGMAMLMNAVNVVFRRMVKNFDDDMTTPNIRRLYDWNMQFSEKEHIKGDYEVDARGTSVLLMREVQAQNLMALLGFTQHPALGMLLKALPLLRKTVQSMMIPADEVVVTDDEFKQMLEDQKNQPPPPDPNVIRAEAQVKAVEMKTQTDLQIAQLNRDTKMMELAEKRNMSIEQVMAALEGKRIEADSKERILATEIAVEARQPKPEPKGEGGSGGYISQ